MNLYAMIILAALLAEFALNAVADMLNLKNLDAPLPDELRDVYGEGMSGRSAEYLRARTKLSLISSGFSLLLVLAFWFAGGFGKLDGLLRGLITDEIWRGIAFIGLLAMAQTILGLPFRIYSVFVIEEKFGFNKTTPFIFIMDMLKAGLLSAIIGIPVLYGVLYLLGYLGAYAWLYAFALLVAFSLLMQYIAPTWIMPLFNKFRPLEEGELRDRIFAIAAKAGFPLKNLFVMDGSKRSSKSNAFFTGFGNNKRIVLFDTLVEKHTADELVAVLAHEIGHYKKKHIRQGMLLGLAQGFVMLYLLSLFMNEKALFDAFYVTEPSVYLGLVFFGLLFSPAGHLVSILMNLISRKNEFEADRFSVTITGEKESMISALKKLSGDNLSNPVPHPFHVFINYSHPPVAERIKAIRSV